MLVTKKMKIEKTKRTMDLIVYSSSAIDVVIAVLTALSYFKIGNPEMFLMPVEYMLTATVVLTAVLGALLLYLKHYETVMGNLLNIHTSLLNVHTNFKYGLANFIIPKIKLNYKFRYRYRGK